MSVQRRILTPPPPGPFAPGHNTRRAHGSRPKLPRARRSGARPGERDDDAKSRADLLPLQSPALPQPSGSTDSGRAASEAHDAEADADRPVDPRVQAMLPADLLQPGEIILLLIKPSAWSIVLESLKTIGVVALIVACCIWAEQFHKLPLHHNDTLLAATTLITLRLFWEFLDWMGRAYILTDRRVVRVQGVSRIHIFEAPLKKIDHTQLTFSNRERVVGLGTVVFHFFDHPFDQVHWRMIAKPGEVYPIVLKAIEKYR